MACIAGDAQTDAAFLRQVQRASPFSATREFDVQSRSGQGRKCPGRGTMEHNDLGLAPALWPVILLLPARALSRLLCCLASYGNLGRSQAYVARGIASHVG